MILATWLFEINNHLLFILYDFLLRQDNLKSGKPDTSNKDQLENKHQYTTENQSKSIRIWRSETKKLLAKQR